MDSADKYLRTSGSSDEAEIHRLLCVPEVYEYLVDGVEPSLSLTSNWIESAVASTGRGGGLWALCAEEGEMVGLTRLADDQNGALELTFLLDPSIWGLGYATRMSHTAMDHAFKTGIVSSIWAGADMPNTASISVMKRLGMTFRREVQYPAGAGVEYVMDASAFEPDRIDRLAAIT